MSQPFLIQVFGKTGCDKCHTLNQRLDKLLNQAEWQEFEKQSVDVETESGLVEFCEAECINPQSIPAMLVLREIERGKYEPITRADPSQNDPICGKSRLYQYLGLQTDYGPDGRGVITPKMIAAVLSEANA